MSGSSSAQVQAILGSNTQPSNMLQTITGFQDLANKQQALKNAQAENAAIQAGTANTQQSTSASQQSQAIQGAVRHSQDMASILALPESQMAAAAQQKADQELATGQISQSQHQVAQQMIDQAKQGDTSAIKAFAAQHIMSTLNGAQQLAAMQPSYSMHDTGNGTQVLAGPSQLQQTQNTAPAPLQQVGQTLPSNLMGQGQLSDLVTVQLPNGQTWQGPKAMSGQVMQSNPGATMGPAGPAVVSPSGAQNNQAFSTVRPTGPLAGGGVVTTPGNSDALAAKNKSSTAQGISLTDTDAVRPQKQALLSDILTQSNVPGAFSGPDAPAFKSLMARFAQIPGVVTPEVQNATSAQDQMEKAMANFQSLQMKSMIGTNAGLAQTIAGSPHIELSKGGLEANVHQLQGTLDAEASMSNAWQKAQANGAAPGSFKDFQQKFINPTRDPQLGTVQWDPRAFWLQRMSPKERSTFVKAANDPSLARNYQYMSNQGLLQ